MKPTPTELLLPRFECINSAPFGFSKYCSIGTIYTSDSLGHFKLDDGTEIMDSIFVGNPHLFKPLNWWEHRAIEDMPEYVRVTFPQNRFCVKAGHYDENFMSTGSNTYTL